jgi:hypothetical protein
MAKAMGFPHSPTTNEVDRLYRQLVEIYAISVAQLAECPTGTVQTPPLAQIGPELAGRGLVR